MPRPKPTIIIEHVTEEDFKSEQVLESEAIWAVFYKNKPFNLKTTSNGFDYPTPKYKKVSFSNPGHAITLAKKLNALFKCTDFTVMKMTAGEQIYPKLNDK